MPKEKKTEAVVETKKSTKGKASVTTKVDKKAPKKLSSVQKIRELENQEIENKIKELKQELFNLRFQAAVGKLENTAQLRKVKKDIARAYTVLTERAKASVQG
ncbi:MAG TPA: 50S ribosomal protein L29 [Acholeplasmataceae bacterium]|jgi:large subunit ribosomal protein L29|nr:50S ribosomal protein L29 [Acholeplasmataceae bacterium]